MKLLALESSSDRCSVALWCDGALSSRCGDGAQTHSGLMLPFVDGLLAEAGLRVKSLDALAFGAGPGGFTGLRLACGVAQGLALAADLPVIAVGSLEAMALGSGLAMTYVCVDARMSEVYCAAYRVEGDRLHTVLEPMVAAPDAAPLPPGPGWHGVGSGFRAYREVLLQRLGEHLVTEDAHAMPDARHIVTLALQRWQRGERPDAAVAVPFYVRDKVALTTAERFAGMTKR